MIPAIREETILAELCGREGDCLRRDEPDPNRIPDEAGGFMDIQFLHDSSPMRLGGLDADAQEFGGFLGGLPFGNELEKLSFTRAERF